LKLKFLKSLSKEKEQDVLSKVEESLDETFLSAFDTAGKEAIAKDIITHVQQASVEKGKILTKSEVLGWLSIILIYMATGFALVLPT
jgi:hypothetical protein